MPSKKFRNKGHPPLFKDRARLVRLIRAFIKSVRNSRLGESRRESIAEITWFVLVRFRMIGEFDKIENSIFKRYCAAVGRVLASEGIELRRPEPAFLALEIVEAEVAQARRKYEQNQNLEAMVGLVEALFRIRECRYVSSDPKMKQNDSQLRKKYREELFEVFEEYLESLLKVRGREVSTRAALQFIIRTYRIRQRPRSLWITKNGRKLYQLLFRTKLEGLNKVYQQDAGVVQFLKNYGYLERHMDSYKLNRESFPI